MKINFFTLGVYGLASKDFFEKITSNTIDTFIDIRRRRAVRGSKYSFVNSKRLQFELKKIGINYLHIIELAPTNEIRTIQKNSDKSKMLSKKSREQLDPEFIYQYKTKILDKYNFEDLFKHLEELNTKKAVFFCVESSASACHRSIVADRLEKDYSLEIKHL